MSQSVASVHWLNWLGQAAVIKLGDLIVAGTVTAISHDGNTGIFDLVIGGSEFRLVASDLITIATPADASQALYGVPLGS